MTLTDIKAVFSWCFDKCINNQVSDNPIIGATIQKDTSGNIIFMTGQFNIVFKIKKDNKYYALRIPTGGSKIPTADMKAIANYIERNSLPYFVNFLYIDNGIGPIKTSGIGPIKTSDESVILDAVLMDWVEGETLGGYIENHKSDPNKLRNIASKFLEMIKYFHQEGIAHGDLQGGNIIVKADDSLVLVDYDSMYIPQFAGRDEVIRGRDGYQHNSRINNSSANKQTEKVDYFSELIIYLSLLAIAEDTTLWVNEDNFIFTQQDLNNSSAVKNTKAYKRLMELSPEIRELTEILCDYIDTANYTDLTPFYKLQKSYKGSNNPPIFYEGLAMIEDNGKVGFIDLVRRVIIPLKYDYAEPFIDGLALVCLEDKYGFIDRTGQEIIPLKYDYAGPFIDGLALVRLGNKYGAIDITGKPIIPIEYDAPIVFSEGLAKVKSGNKWGFINKVGTVVVPIIYDKANDFCNGLALVCLEDKYGFIDRTGQKIIPLKYDYAESFSEEGFAFVRLNANNSYIDITGKVRNT